MPYVERESSKWMDINVFVCVKDVAGMKSGNRNSEIRGQKTPETGNQHFFFVMNNYPDRNQFFSNKGNIYQKSNVKLNFCYCFYNFSCIIRFRLI